MRAARSRSRSGVNDREWPAVGGRHGCGSRRSGVAASVRAGGRAVLSGGARIRHLRSCHHIEHRSRSALCVLASVLYLAIWFTGLLAPGAPGLLQVLGSVPILIAEV